MTSARITATGGWIDASYDGGIVTMAVVGPPLVFLVKDGATTAQRQKRTDERGRYRRMAIDALRSDGADDSVADADFAWSHRAG